LPAKPADAPAQAALVANNQPRPYILLLLRPLAQGNGGRRFRLLLLATNSSEQFADIRLTAGHILKGRIE
jgi:hypothetical protein